MRKLMNIIEGTGLVLLSQLTNKSLAEKIFEFLDAHAKIAGDYDPEWDESEARFNGPDSSMLFSAANLLAKGQTPIEVHSSWSSGCYKGWQDKNLEKEHDTLVHEVNLRARATK